MPGAARAETERQPPDSARRTRLLTAVALCDGHDSAIMSVNQELVRAGAEVVYLGYHRAAAEIARAAVQEDVRAVGISSYNGGHTVFFQAVADELRRRGRDDIRLFGGGGATITRADVAELRRGGVDRIFYAGTPLGAIIRDVLRRYGSDHRGSTEPAPEAPDAFTDAALGRWLTLLETTVHVETEHQRLLGALGDRQRHSGPAAQLPAAERAQLRRVLDDLTFLTRHRETFPGAARQAPVIGFSGPGGAGKSTLIDELVLRFLARGSRRIAVLSNDPSVPGSGGAEPGALLGDRATMIYSQDDRVFQRSLATRGNPGVSAALPAAIRLARSCPFDLVLVETAGSGQDLLPFPPEMIDCTVLVLTPEYGSRLQLQKIALLAVADVVVLNKADRPSAAAAVAELRGRLQSRAESVQVFQTVASRHRDAGIDTLLSALQQATRNRFAPGDHPVPSAPRDCRRV